MDNGDSTVRAIAAQLKSEGIPYTTVDLTDSGRPVIDGAFLSDTVGGVVKAKYQGVMLPNEAPFGAGSAEQTALESYDRFTLKRSVDAFRTVYQELAGRPEVYRPGVETVADWTEELRDPWYATAAAETLPEAGAAAATGATTAVTTAVTAPVTTAVTAPVTTAVTADGDGR
ncbi:hypothetical protein [Streptomyces sp. YIM S03343]